MPSARFDGRIHHVLIVEDSAIIALDLEYSLEELGVARVTVAGDVGKAMAALKANDVDAALIDVFLDHEDGLAVARQAKALNIPFALMTGLGESPVLREQFPSAPILGKPFSGQELADTLELLCGG